MAATLAHELNQPIGTVTNLLYGIKQRLTSTTDDAQSIIDAVEVAQIRQSLQRKL